MPARARASGASKRAVRRRWLACAALVPSVLSFSVAALGEGSAAEGSAANQAPAAAASPAWANAYARGQWSASIELLETIPEVSRTAWHWLHLARAREKRGQLVESFAAYERLLDVAADAPGAPGMKEVKQQAQAESAALALRIPWAQVTLSSDVPLGGLVYVDHQWLEPERLRLPYPVNPGWHTFLVESNGQVLAARRVHFEEAQSRLVPLASFAGGEHPAAALGHSADVARADAESGAPSPQDEHAATSLARDDDPWGIDGANSRWGTPPATGAVGSGIASNESARAAPEPSSAPAGVEGAPSAGSARALEWHAPEEAADEPTDGLLTSAYVSLGIGAVGALVGTGFAIAAHNARDEVEVRSVGCFYEGCLDAADAASSQWRRRATIAGASYAVGLMGLVTGGLLWLAHREYSSSKATLQIADLEIELEPGLRTDGAYLRGRF